MIRFEQKYGKINDNLVAWVDITFVDANDREYRLTIHPTVKKRLHAYLRLNGFKIGIIQSEAEAHNKVMVV